MSSFFGLYTLSLAVRRSFNLASAYPRLFVSNSREARSSKRVDIASISRSCLTIASLALFSPFSLITRSRNASGPFHHVSCLNGTRAEALRSWAEPRVLLIILETIPTGKVREHETHRSANKSRTRIRIALARRTNAETDICSSPRSTRPR